MIPDDLKKSTDIPKTLDCTSGSEETFSRSRRIKVPERLNLWSTRTDVLIAQVTSHNEIKNALEDLIEDNTQTHLTRELHLKDSTKHTTKFQTTLLMVIWDEILQRVDKTNEKRDPDFERMSPRERFRAGVFLPTIENLVVQLNKRKDCYEVLNPRFEIFRNLHEKEQEVPKQAKYLAQSSP
ncbi:dimer_Tnp_hAT domain-containing protein [Trichonephila clavipes]|uniref:Dimer_Tnp_hAT domain-containing protein n=1 Tax=Trichonephila clavipes TaxID=2585209 RepID=A0A8X7B8M8_TRICX|nr:dimer_Tnp_hAT domain-containing protein [Trichonephila clavipes]